MEIGPAYASTHLRWYAVPGGDPLALTIPDPLHSEEADRFITLGESHRRQLLVVCTTDRVDKTRIISARVASRRERKDYEEGSKK